MDQDDSYIVTGVQRRKNSVKKAKILGLKKLKIKSMAHGFQGSHTGQLDFCN